ncbi:LysM peptidoglycan-binding domain-containing protein [Streptosporangium sp. NPDC020072]|uniref:LysM peptidoglycan-binding domain-containing protein n=1 Tax=Streptosporangium sp. NPDC020072 TaxID=3154788 RepID=UPI00343EE088
MATATDVLAYAKSLQGQYSRPNPFSLWYSARHRMPFKTSAWCAMFATYVGYRTGMVAEFGEFASCPLWVSDLKRRKRWTKRPEVGALVFYDWNDDGQADHVGLVVRVLSGGRIEAIEGNTRKGGHVDRVALQTRSPGDVLGYGRISYTPDTGTTYVVKSGDTLARIAQRYGTTWQKVHEANRATIGADPGKILPGQRLKIPHGS